ncbi:MAG: MBL fold metallo-hydrolase [Candidatus Dormibacteraeota bacterium]|nr:MBL fold metallo-hydrolase [Candidatus Dormibacteraeota bacterium]
METIAPGVHQLDTLLGGWERMTAGFLIDGPEPALVETGSQSSVPAVRHALEAAGVGADQLRWLVLTHIHLDHAGGIGDLAEAFPKATVVVHERGARHLVDPARLIDSSARVYGPLLDDLYGRIKPVPEERLVAAADNHRIQLGNGRVLRLIDSPGHARHHHAVLDESSGTLLVGDAVGVLLPDIGLLRPAAPPPEFNLEDAVASLHRFAEVGAERVVLTHYGPVPGDGQATLAEAEEVLRSWVGVAERAVAASADAGVEGIAKALADAFLTPPEQLEEGARERLEILNGVHSNAAGIARYLARRQPAPAAAPG